MEKGRETHKRERERERYGDRKTEVKNGEKGREVVRERLTKE